MRMCPAAASQLLAAQPYATLLPPFPFPLSFLPFFLSRRRADRLNQFLEYATSKDNVFLVTVSQVRSSLGHMPVFLNCLPR
jgi:hypothetical protein